MKTEVKTMRDVFIEELCKRMHKDKSIFFLCADFGSPKLDYLRENFKSRFINVGIAEQNLINVSAGLASEGFNVYAYAIAPFLTMRAYEQIRVNLSLYAQLKKINVNLVGVGAGLSYDVSGPTHHCLEDISIIRSLPHVSLFSPSDWVLVKNFIDYSIKVKGPKYIRLDGKPLANIYNNAHKIKFEKGFRVLKNGKRICLISTGYMTHKALKIAEILSRDGIHIGVIDVFLLRPIDRNSFSKILSNYKIIATIEEGFVGVGGLDGLVLDILAEYSINVKFKNLGFKNGYVFDIGDRNYLHGLNGLDELSIIKKLNKCAAIK